MRERRNVPPAERGKALDADDNRSQLPVFTPGATGNFPEGRRGNSGRGCGLPWENRQSRSGDMNSLAKRPSLFCGCFYGKLPVGSAMKIAFLWVAVASLSGCSYYDRLAMQRFEKKQAALYDLYISGSRSEAKRAMEDKIELYEQQGRKLKLFHGINWALALSYARLALLSEEEKDTVAATKSWDCAVAAAIEQEKIDLSEKRGDQAIIDDRPRVIAALRDFIEKLESDLPVKWKSKERTG